MRHTSGEAIIKKGQLRELQLKIADEVIRTNYLPLELIGHARKLRLEIEALTKQSDLPSQQGEKGKHI